MPPGHNRRVQRGHPVRHHGMGKCSQSWTEAVPCPAPAQGHRLCAGSRAVERGVPIQTGPARGTLGARWCAAAAPGYRSWLAS